MALICQGSFLCRPENSAFYSYRQPPCLVHIQSILVIAEPAKECAPQILEPRIRMKQTRIEQRDVDRSFAAFLLACVPDDSTHCRDSEERVGSVGSRLNIRHSLCEI